MTEYRPEENANQVPGQPTDQAGEQTQSWGQPPSAPASPYGEAPTQSWGQPPASPYGAQPTQPIGQPQQPAQQTPSNPYAYNPQAAQQPQQPPQAWGQQQDPYQTQQFGGHQPPYGVPGQAGQQAPWGAQQPGQPAYPGQPGQQWGPADPYGNPYVNPYGQVPEKKRSLAWLWVLLGVVGLSIVGLVVALLTGLIGGPDLDRLYNQCASGSGQACEDLYQAAPAGSSDELFGKTCGGRTDGTGAKCTDPSVDMSLPANSWGTSSAPLPDDERDDAEDMIDDGEFGVELSGPAPLAIDDPNGCMSPECEPGLVFGDNPRLDNLYTACESGDMDACDDLFWIASFGSEYEEFAGSCGDVSAGESEFWCSTRGDEWVQALDY